MRLKILQLLPRPSPPVEMDAEVSVSGKSRCFGLTSESSVVRRCYACCSREWGGTPGYSAPARRLEQRKKGQNEGNGEIEKVRSRRNGWASPVPLPRADSGVEAGDAEELAELGRAKTR